ncbi:MAG: hypothetical protein EP332_00925 [Bacteroidetes bacterium]|nr:MAG: hypothetical protein EP332_00925 [Bacteroidota bacterium]
MAKLRFTPVSGEVQIELPSSKSHSNRLLILQALAEEPVVLHPLSDARDTVILKKLLEQIRLSNGAQLDLDCLDAGTVFRFLMAYCSVNPGSYRLFGSERLMERPITDLVSALQSLGASLKQKPDAWYITGKALDGGELELSNVQSSQFVSALLLVAPALKKGLHLTWRGEKHSWPYVAMTLQCLSDFGVGWERIGDEIWVKPGLNPKAEYQVERDWSSAAFFFPFLANRTDLSLSFPGLRLQSLQGDAFVERLFRYEGMQASEMESGIKVNWSKPEWSRNALSLNLNRYPDLAPPLVIYYLLQDRDVDFTGLESLALKESIRDAVLADAVAHCGGQFAKQGEQWLLRSRTMVNPKALATHNDHRMAMAFSLLAMQFNELELSEAESVAKSFPQFWQEVKKLGLTLL